VLSHMLLALDLDTTLSARAIQTTQHSSVRALRGVDSVLRQATR